MKMTEQSEQGILEVARAYVLAQDGSPFVVPELREGERLFALAGRDSRVTSEVAVQSIALAHRTETEATVEVLRSAALRQRSKTSRCSSELTLELVNQQASW